MIERLVLVKLKDEFAAPDARSEVARHSRQALAAVPGVRGVAVLEPADERSAGDWDLCLRVRLDDLAAVRAYADDPRHREYVDGYLRPRIEVIKAWNFRASAIGGGGRSE